MADYYEVARAHELLSVLSADELDDIAPALADIAPLTLALVLEHLGLEAEILDRLDDLEMPLRPWV